jgi:murein L,D-transpeptidase YafK
MGLSRNSSHISLTKRLMKKTKGALILGASSVAIAAAAWAHWPRTPLADDAVASRVIVLKSDRRLELYDGPELLRSYDISLGREPVGPKRKQGDRRTPEGSYRIDFRKADSSFHRALHISYPRADQIAAARARGEPAGGLIMIHGLPNGTGYVGRLHLLMDWTLGCIAVTNTEIEEIWRVVPNGTRIEIRP